MFIRFFLILLTFSFVQGVFDVPVIFKNGERLWFCCSKWRKRSDVKMHFMLKHNPANKPCSVCGILFHSKAQIDSHKQKEHNIFTQKTKPLKIKKKNRVMAHPPLYEGVICPGPDDPGDYSVWVKENLGL